MGLPHLSVLLTLTPCLVALLPGIHAGDGLSAQTLASLAEYLSQAPCATSCFYRWEGSCSADLVGSALGCEGGCTSWASNDCYCRTHYQSLATSYLYSCVAKGCTRGNAAFDVFTATSLYGAYCLQAGYADPTATLVGGETLYVTMAVTRPAGAVAGLQA